MTEPNTWEYKVEELPPTTERLEEELRFYGKSDWELCEIIWGSCIIFKRHIFRSDL